MLGFSVSNEELKAFIEELGEQLQQLELLVLDLEKATTVEGVNKLFRITHTIKGSAASIGHQEMAALAHAMESVLEEARRNHRRFSPQMIDLLLRSLDALKMFAHDLRAGKPGSRNITALLDQLHSSLDKTRSGLSMAYELAVNFSNDCQMPAVRATQVLLALKKCSEIMSSQPAEENLKESSETFSTLVVHLRTSGDSEAIKKIVLEVSEVAAVDVKKLDLKSPPPGAGGLSEISGDLKIRTLRVDVNLFDNLINLVGELVTGKTRLLKIGSYLKNWQDVESLSEEVSCSIQDLSKIIGQLQEEVMKARLVPIEIIFNKFPRVIRDLSLSSGKEIDFTIEGQDTQLDRLILEEISDPIIHLLRNAVDHGIESHEERKLQGKSARGKISLKAYHMENHVMIELQDDGRGIDVDKIRQLAAERGILSKNVIDKMSREEVINIIFASGFSTASQVSKVSGRGVGLDIVKQRIQKIGGNLEVITHVGKGTAFKLRLPFSLAIVQGLQVEAQGITFILPLSCVSEIIRVNNHELKRVGHTQVAVVRNQVIPLVWLKEFYGEPVPLNSQSYSVVVLAVDQNRIGVVVDSILGKQEFVIKTMGPYIGDHPGISGATVLADGSVGLILDARNFVYSIRKSRHSMDTGKVAV